jgi:CRISPR-associated protein Csb2
MLTLAIRYLTDRVVATGAGDRRQVEWPPHPGRVFMALAAAHFQTGADTAERAALEWLETQPAPQIHAPKHIERPVLTHYVPVNDKAGPSKAPLQSAAGLTRARQPRTWGSAWLEDGVVYVFWPDAEPKTHFPVLDKLCAKVTRVGHSASLVQMWALQEPPGKSVNWLPDHTRATGYLRVMGPGLLRYLERRFNQHEVDQFCELKVAADDASDKNRQKVARTMLRERFQNQAPVRLWPELSLSQGYVLRQQVAPPSVPGTVFDPHLLVFALSRLDGPYRHLDLVATLQVTGRFRQALLQHLGANAPEALSGHRGEARSERPHVALLPLPFVGHEHAHGGILGVAVAVPRDLEAADRRRLRQALDGLRREGLKLGALGRWRLDRPETGASPMTLRDRAWTSAQEGAHQWATVTPYVYDRHAKDRDKVAHQRELANAVRESWERVRQSPEVSVEVVITPVSAHLGAPASHQFPRIVRKDGSQCRHTHVILIFNRPVVGPVLLGAGRYRGYGLCRAIGGEG